MSRYKKNKPVGFIKNFFWDNLPNSRDNLKQLLIKITFLLCIIGILCGGAHFAMYYSQSISQQRIMDNDRRLFQSGNIEHSSNLLHKQNNDYRGWISMEGTKLNNPIYKAHNNSFYMTRNSLKEMSRYGSLCLDYRFNLSDKNVVIYGNTADDGLMLSTLHNLRRLDFYKENSVITLSNAKNAVKYKIYAVFVLNSSKSQDDGNIYNIYKKDFSDESKFDKWVNEARLRSVINTGVDVCTDDKILTLVTACEDFENARLVVMARSERDSENLTSFTENPTVNPKPKYPKKWYEDRNIPYPF